MLYASLLALWLDCHAVEAIKIFSCSRIHSSAALASRPERFSLPNLVRVLKPLKRIDVCDV